MKNCLPLKIQYKTQLVILYDIAGCMKFNKCLFCCECISYMNLYHLYNALHNTA